MLETSSHYFNGSNVEESPFSTRESLLGLFPVPNINTNLEPSLNSPLAWSGKSSQSGDTEREDVLSTGDFYIGARPSKMSQDTNANFDTNLNGPSSFFEAPQDFSMLFELENPRFSQEMSSSRDSNSPLNTPGFVSGGMTNSDEAAKV